jgi:hypothetical protein
VQDNRLQCYNDIQSVVRKQTPKILEAVSLTKNKTKMFYDEMQFDAPVLSKHS